MADQTPAVREDWSGAKDKIRDMLGQLATFDEIAEACKPAPQRVVRKLYEDILLEHARAMESANNLDEFMKFKGRQLFMLRAIADLGIAKYKLTCTEKRPAGKPILLSLVLQSLRDERVATGMNAPERIETKHIKDKPEVDPSAQRLMYSDPELQRLELQLARRSLELQSQAADADRLRSKGVWGQLELPSPPVPSDRPSGRDHGGPTEEADPFGTAPPREV